MLSNFLDSSTFSFTITSMCVLNSTMQKTKRYYSHTDSIFNIKNSTQITIHAKKNVLKTVLEI